MRVTTVILILVLTTCTLASWTLVPSTGDIPYNRSSGEMREINGELILFGGYDECYYADLCDHTFFNEVYHFNIETSTWYKPTITPDPVHGVPNVRAYFGATVDRDEDALVIYGGGSFPVQFIDFGQWVAGTQDYDGLWYYYPDSDDMSGRWEKIETVGSITPGARSGSEIEIFEGKLYLIGGISSTSFFSVEDTWSLDLATRQWTQLTGGFSSYASNPFPFPVGRYIFPLVRKGAHLYAYSGNIIPIPPLLGVQYQDLWRYSIETNEWDSILPFDVDASGQPNGFTGRVHGGMEVVRNRLVVFFGDDNDDEHECYIDSISSGQSPVDETWVFDLNSGSTTEWRKIDVVGDVPALKRMYNANSKSHRKIFVFGGLIAECEISQFDTTIVSNNEIYTLSWNDITHA